MLSVILSWIYIFLVCMLVGTGVLGFFKKKQFSLIYYLVAGNIAITVYAEFFSLFGKTGACAHGILLAGALVAGFINRNRLRQIWQEYRGVLFSWEGFLLLFCHSDCVF